MLTKTNLRLLLDGKVLVSQPHAGQRLCLVVGRFLRLLNGLLGHASLHLINKMNNRHFKCKLFYY